MKDSFYTSTILAEILVNYVEYDKINTVVDFCVGGGELLRSAQSKWKDVEVFGTDISNEAISLLHKNHPDWKVEYCDFINDNSRLSCKILENNKFDLILLNPPFTCKGSTIHKTKFDGIYYNVSTAMLFLLNSISYLSPNGAIYAILPISVAYSQKDSKIWNILEQKHNMTILEERDKQYFKNCYPPNIILVSLNDFKNKKPKETRKSIEFRAKIEAIIRGQISMNEIIEDSTSTKLLIHSTNLRNNKIVDVSFKVQTNHHLIIGPGIIIHRVGNPNPLKICTIKKTDKYILSDCLIFIKTKTHQDADEIKNQIILNWSSFEKLYKGTGAKYITIKRLSFFLNYTNNS